MATLQFTKSIENNQWKLQFEIQGGDIPHDIFMYENLGESLGEYQAVTTISEWFSLQTFNPTTPVPVFGNKFIKHNKGLLYVPLTREIDSIINKITVDVKSFKTAFISQTNTTTVVQI